MPTSTRSKICLKCTNQTPLCACGCGKKVGRNYGVDTPRKWIRGHHATLKRFIAKPNSKEKKLDTILQQNFPKEFKLNVKGGVVIGGKIPDFVNVNGRKMLVELFGDYWHGKRVTGRGKEYEVQRRKDIFKRWGFSTLVIWESELVNPDRVIRRVAFHMNR